MKILAVDDEKPILDWLAHIINNLSFCELVAATNHADDAIQILEKNEIDLLLTDIVMPGMDGLELIRRAHLQNQQIPCILLSNHADFNYAQKALTLGATEYVLKAEITRESLGALLAKYYHQLSKQREEQEKLEAEHFAVFLYREVQELKMNKMAQKYFWSEKNIDVSKPYTLICFSCSGYCDEKIVRLMVKIKNKFRLDHILLVQHHSFRFLGFTEHIGFSDFQKLLDNISQVFGTLGYKKNIYFLSTKEPFEMAYCALYLGFLYSQKASYDYDCGLLTQTKSHEHIEAILKILIYHIQAHKLEHAIEKVDMFFETLKYLDIHYAPQAKNYCEKLLDCLKNDKSWPHNDEVCALKTLQDYRQAALMMTANAQRYYQNQEGRQEIIVEQSHNYIKEHFHEPIFLADVAGNVHISPEYFSRLFREVTGETFSNYLVKLRLSKARELLVNTKMKISEVGKKVGFNSPSYFTKTYRKYMGCCPEEERYP